MFDHAGRSRSRARWEELRWVNPHVSLSVNGTIKEGEEPALWVLEMTSPGNLVRAGGWSRNAVKPGDRVEVVMSPLRDADKKGGALKKLRCSETGQVFTSHPRAGKAGAGVTKPVILAMWLLATAGIALAHEQGVTPPKDAIFARKILMGSINTNMDEIETMLSPGETLNLAEGQEHADIISIMLMAFPHMFPAATNQWKEGADRDAVRSTPTRRRRCGRISPISISVHGGLEDRLRSEPRQERRRFPRADAKLRDASQLAMRLSEGRLS
jgi:hypothetical protein